MKLSFRHAMAYVAFGLGTISSQVGAAIDPSKNLSTNIKEVAGRPADLFMPEAGALISIALIALVLIARRIKHND